MTATHMPGRLATFSVVRGLQGTMRGSPREMLDRCKLRQAVRFRPRNYTCRMSSSIADLRKSYERAELSEDASQADPLQQFDRWLQEAIQGELPEPNAMTPATPGSKLRPS